MPARKSKWLLMGIVALIWGSSFILIKRGLVGLDPYELGALRMVFAGLFLLPIGFRELPKIPREKWKFVVLTGVVGSFVPAFLFALAETRIGSSISAILNSLTPIGTLLIGILFFKFDFKRNQLLGVVIGLTGSLLLILSGSEADGAQDYRYAGFVVIATLFYATNVNLLKRYLSDVSPMAISIGNYTALLIPSLVILSCGDFFAKVGQVDVQHSVFFMAILGILGTGVANLLFFKVIQMSTPVFASSVTYLIPIVAFFWGLLDHESLTAWQVLGALVVLAGVYLSGRK